MAQVILIERNKTINDLITVNLSTYLGLDVIQRPSGQEAINLLAILPTINLIITYHTLLSEPTGELLKKYIKDNKLDTKLIIMGGNPPHEKVIDEIAAYVPDSKDWEKVVQTAAKILGINEAALAKKVMPDYIPVPVRYFLNLESTNSDVFIRIKKSATEFQFLKRIHNGDTFSKDSIKRYIEQGLEHFYIPKESHKNFTTYLSNSLVMKIDNPDLDVNEKLEIMGESYEVAVKEIKNMGFTTETIQLSETIVQNMVKNFEQSAEMSGFLHKIINSQSGLLFQRSHMTSIVACEMAKNLNVTDKKAYEKIAYAAFFHDISFTDKELLSKLNSIEELEQANLNDMDYQLVFNHAQEAAEIVKKHPEAPLGTSDIILHHHGANAGKGFSNQIEKLPLGSKIFLVAHNFVLELVRFKELGGDPRPITVELHRRYSSPDMTTIIKSLETALKKPA